MAIGASRKNALRKGNYSKQTKTFPILFRINRLVKKIAKNPYLAMISFIITILGTPGSVDVFLKFLNFNIQITSLLNILDNFLFKLIFPVLLLAIIFTIIIFYIYVKIMDRLYPVVPSVPPIADDDKKTHSNIFQNIPYPKNNDFIGRIALLNEIQSQFSVDSSESVIIVDISGLGGVGKTQLAIEYAINNQHKYKLLWWLKAENPDNLEYDYIELSNYFGLTYKSDTNKQVLLNKIKQKLEETGDWLLIFDNALSQEKIQDYIPKSKKGHILITSRDQNWQNVNKTILLGVFKREESAEYIRKKLTHSTESDDDIDRLAEELGDLPLALSQACSYIYSFKLTISEYLKRFHTYQRDILDSGRILDYPKTVATTWKISFEAISVSNKSSIDLLNLISFLAPDDLPLDLFKNNPVSLGKNIADLFSNDILMDRAKESLFKYSLIQYDNRKLSVHRLVQLVTRNNLDQKEAEKWIASLIVTMNDILPEGTESLEDRQIVTKLLPHIANIISLAEARQITSTGAITLISKVGTLLYTMSEYKKAILYDQKALDIFLKNGNKQEISNCYINLGKANLSLGNYYPAIDYLNKALEIKLEIFDKLGESTCYVHLGSAYYRLGDYKKDLRYQNKALKIFKEIGNKRGELSCYIYLGSAYYRLGNYKKSIIILSNAKRLGEEINDRMGLSNCFVYLGSSYYRLGEYAKAIEYQETALKIKQEIGDRQGESKCYNNLGNAYNSLAEYDKDINFQELALTIKLEIGDRQGESKCYNYLGNAYCGMGDHAKAIEYQEMALKIKREIGDKQGESTCYVFLGSTYYHMGSYDKAFEYLKLALEIKQDIGDRLGESTCYYYQGCAYYRMDNYSAAENSLTRAIAIKNKIGDTQGESLCYCKIGDIYCRMKKNQRAIEYYTNALNGFKKTQQQHFIRKAQQRLEQAQVQSGYGNAINNLMYNIYHKLKA